MPTVLRSGRFRFFFFSNEGQEPPHIHVKAGGDEAKFWLDPTALAGNSLGAGLRPRRSRRPQVSPAIPANAGKSTDTGGDLRSTVGRGRRPAPNSYEIERLIEEHRLALLEAWNEHLG